MDLTIIITSFKRAKLLKWGLLSIVKQNIKCNYEILVLNDGIDDDTKAVCDSFTTLPIHYIFTGRRNYEGIKWRCPGFAVNIGIKLAQGRNIIISCAEMYLLDKLVQEMVDTLDKNKKNIVITEGKDDYRKTFLDSILRTNGNPSTALYDSSNLVELCTRYPFFMGLNKQWILNIGGYDEDFIGYAYDDTDFSRRLVQDGGNLIKLNKRVIHLYHKRVSDRPGIDKNKDLAYNKKLYDERNNITIRNVGKEWGVLNV